jgi:hypothetical protein
VLHFRFGLGGIGIASDAAASYLGLTEDQLRTQLASGKSLAEIATAQGKSVSGLEQALEDAAKAKLDAAVKAGKLTADQETKILAGISQFIDQAVNATPGAEVKPGPGGFPGPGDAFGFGFGFGLHGALGVASDAAATYLGLTKEQLRTQLQSGKSLAQIATAQGKSVSGLEQALLDAAKTKLDAAVKAGKLTADQETKILAGISQFIDQAVNATPGSFHLHFGVHRAHGWQTAPAPAAPGGSTTPTPTTPAPTTTTAASETA